MKPTDGKRLSVNDRVRWAVDGALGTVMETSYAAIKIRWDDGQWSLFPFLDSRPWENLEIAKPSKGTPQRGLRL
jgi:hypothetical protein